MRGLTLALLAQLTTAWVAAPPRRRPTRLAAKKKSRKLERLQELKEGSGAELDATEQWAANLEQRLDAVASDGERDEKAAKSGNVEISKLPPILRVYFQYFRSTFCQVFIILLT